MVNDAHAIPANFPDGRLAKAAASGDMVVFSLPKDVYESDAAQNFIKALIGWCGLSQERSTRANINIVSDDEFFAAGLEASWLTSRWMRTAYQLTKAFLSSLDTVMARTPFMSNVWLGETDPSKTGLCSAVPIQYHPGAIRAWEEAGHDPRLRKALRLAGWTIVLSEDNPMSAAETEPRQKDIASHFLVSVSLTIVVFGLANAMPGVRASITE